MKIVSIFILLVIMCPAYAGFKLDLSLTDRQAEVFKRDVRHLNSMELNDVDITTKQYFSLTQLTGKTLFNKFSNSIIAITGENFAPLFCLHNNQKNNWPKDGFYRQKVASLFSKVKDKKIPVCEIPISVESRKLPNHISTYSLQSPFKNTKIITNYDYFTELDIKGSAYFSDGSLMPQSSDGHRIILLSSKMEDNIPLGLTLKSLKNDPASGRVIRISSYLSSAFSKPGTRYCKSVMNREYLCDKEKNGFFDNYGRLLLLFSENCNQCNEENRIKLIYSAIDSLSRISKSVENFTLVESKIREYKTRFIKAGLNIDRIKERNTSSLIQNN